MSRIRCTNTRPELVLRHALWENGFRYRLYDKRLPGKPDIVLSKYRTVIFVHGCFWHGHKDCKYYTVPKTNTEFWVTKVDRNQERDQEVWRKLEAKGWSVIIVWECQLKKAVINKTIGRIEAEIIRNGDLHRTERDNRQKAQAEYMLRGRQKKEQREVLKAELKSLFNKE